MSSMPISSDSPFSFIVEKSQKKLLILILFSFTGSDGPVSLISSLFFGLFQWLRFTKNI